MKIVVQLLLLAGLGLGATTSGAAPHAAEEPSAVVISTTASPPRVKHENLHQAKSVKKHDKGQKASTKNKKKSAKKIRKTH